MGWAQGSIRLEKTTHDQGLIWALFALDYGRDATKILACLSPNDGLWPGLLRPINVLLKLPVVRIFYPGS